MYPCMYVYVMGVTQKRKSAGSSSVGETEAFTLLILHLAFDLFKEPESTIELLQDIYICREKAAKKQKSKSSDGGNNRNDVITLFYVRHAQLH